MLLVIGIGAGVILGVLATVCALKRGAVGNLVIVDDPEDGSYIFLEISKMDIEGLRALPSIKLNVVNKGRTPHK